MDRVPPHHYITAMATIGTRLFTWLHGRVFGRDGAGNVYYEGRRPRADGHRRRWVIYAGDAEASRVPPEWHAWLHFTTDAPLAAGPARPWQKPHQPNFTGTPMSYRPAGHDYAGGHRAPATGDYEAWTPTE
jgi:NADH:ubiquinone oxidoreductase subunit